ncbi:MAG: DUF3726 domain-containing protein [Alphaproteobacteria bacterium]
MSYSYYEVYTNAQRAFSSLGFPYGADEDAAYIITWFELYNLKGIDLFCSFITTNDRGYNYKIDLVKNERVIDLNNKSNLITGPGVIDYIVSKFNKSNLDEFSLINCYDPIFLIPLLSRYIKKNIYGKIINNNEILCLVNKENISINKILFEKKINNSIKIILSNIPNKNKKLDIDINLLNSKKYLSLGLNPNQNNWDKMSELAFKAYVPESEESRSKGAGGGDAND